MNIYEKIKDYVEMTPSECEFIYGLIKEKKPKKIIEVGVSSGASSALILDAIGYDKEAKLFSVDLEEKYYKDRSKNVGFLVGEKFKDFLPKYQLYTGGTIANFIEKIGKDIDFVFLDAAHGLPGEVLDFLTILPYCNAKATIVLHDVNIQTIHPTKTLSTAPKILLCSVSADKILPKYTEYPIYNIGAFEINHLTKENIEDVFSALLIRWVRPMSIKQAEKFKEILEKNYNEKLVKYFDIACNKFRYEKQSSQKSKNWLKNLVKSIKYKVFN